MAMRKRVNIALALALLGIVGVIRWQILCQREPAYRGKRLRAWLSSYARNERRSEAEEAVRQIGTNAIPTLLALLRAKDNQYVRELFNLTGGRDVPADSRNRAAFFGFAILGRKAEDAVPRLIEILRDDPPQQRWASLSLGAIGQPAATAMPLLVRVADDMNNPARGSAFWAIGRIH